MNRFRDIQSHVPDDENDVWMDMVFDVTAAHSKDGRFQAKCFAMAQGVEVGFIDDMPYDWTGIELEQEKMDYRQDSVLLRSVGAPTIALLDWMHKWPDPEKPYEDDWTEGWDPTWRHEGGQLSLSAACLSATKDDPYGFVRLKLMHEYSPFWMAFLNLDLAADILSINEKDPEYRLAQTSTFRRIWGQ